ncbi:MAG: hypothetical protein EWV91_08590 [Microcystis aeruginosa Ma_QC_Ca_00000000_S207]|uniref:Uncharacterized protein n=1 Tax=Microcystis aeruginosa Ma_QC_Ca_00000000_S207 TaxID=2486251 RepID=A0A552FQ49_MICAE|nr:MAG: hypothetical protein EWV91_08590 [Microcystis aeruginosa Ma_QC_Ca_00000000_S207]
MSGLSGRGYKWGFLFLGLGVRIQEIILFIFPTPYTPHPTPHTPHPTPHTLHPTPYTPHPTPHLRLRLNFNS